MAGSESEPDDGTDWWTVRLRPNDPGQAFKTLAIVSTVSLFLSLVGIVLYPLLPGDRSTDTITAPPVATLFGSWIGILVSTFGYSVWSFWQLRDLSGDQEAFNRQLRRSALAFAIGMAVILTTLSLLFGNPPGDRHSLW